MVSQAELLTAASIASGNPAPALAGGGALGGQEASANVSTTTVETNVTAEQGIRSGDRTLGDFFVGSDKAGRQTGITMSMVLAIGAGVAGVLYVMRKG